MKLRKAMIYINIFILLVVAIMMSIIKTSNDAYYIVGGILILGLNVSIINYDD